MTRKNDIANEDIIQTKSVSMRYKRAALLRTLKHVLTAEENDLRGYLKDVKTNEEQERQCIHS